MHIFGGGVALEHVVQRDTYFTARIDPLTKRMIKIVRFNGEDVRTFILKGMIYKISNGTRTVHPDLRNLLLEMEEQFKREYQENIALLEEFREALDRNWQGPGNVVQRTTKVVQCTPGSVCGWCDRPLKNDGTGMSCTCADWKSKGQCYEEVKQ